VRRPCAVLREPLLDALELLDALDLLDDLVAALEDRGEDLGFVVRERLALVLRERVVDSAMVFSLPGRTATQRFAAGNGVGQSLRRMSSATRRLNGSSFS
jgi:hypothetical protein